MSAHIPPGYAEIAIQFNLGIDPEPMFSFLGVKLASGTTPTSALTNTYTSTCAAALDNVLSSAYSVGPGWVTWGQDGGDVKIDSANPPDTGLGTASALPNNTAVLVRKVTAAGGRRGRGRMYIPGIVEGDVDAAGGINNTPRAAWQTAIDAMFTNLVGLPSIDALALLHDTAPFGPNDITSLEVQLKVATQRRRMRP